jgi:hypothetical protein
MTIEAKVYDCLRLSTSIYALTSNAIYPSILPQNATYPALVYKTIGGRLIYALDGYKIENPHFLVEGWTTAYSQTKSLANVVIDAMENSTFQYLETEDSNMSTLSYILNESDEKLTLEMNIFKAMLQSDTDIYDDDKELYGISMQFTVW